ncbi:DNA polymerase-3 subunit alpha [Parapedobacter koreensis]|uniref:DNA-directed DNA polymerase n=2 Tax=Parapedobacter koreensis TaxID=332977 RepID=A0A1H7EXY2_9SPHI|nr:DNA polymerase-3 subunit alpha [Parapedobacter koreensis]
MLLNLHSYFSLRYGTMSLDDLIQGMLLGGHDTAVLTDINNSSGSLDFLRKGREHGLNILAGMELRNGDTLLYVGVARNQAGFRELNEFRTRYNQEGRLLPDRAPEFKDVFVVYPHGTTPITALRDFEYIGIRPAQLNQIRMEPVANFGRYVILAPVTFAPQDYKLHQQLRAIDHNLLFSQLDKSMIAAPDEVFVPHAQLMAWYRDFPQLIQHTNRLLGQCSFDFDFSVVKNKATFTDHHQRDREMLHQYTMDGFGCRYGKHDHAALERVTRELAIIEKLHFSSYFLITDDICRHARGRGFHYVGRGSGANSAVAYCLGITDVDPIALHLPFERFLNPKRQRPPDFDIDFSWNERDTIYDYIFNRYQSGHTALMGAMSTFRSRSILRELGKVYGLPKAEIDRLVNEPENMLNKNEVTDTILSVYNRMTDFPNQRTIHASGVLIAELPLTNYSAMDYSAKGLPTMQLDMHVAEDIGFEKFDILSQRGIGHIRDCREIVRQRTGQVIDTSNPSRFFTDPNIAAQLKCANTIGCFYLESPAMRQLLIKLQCDNYLTLVAASSIIRPGVASSGMMAEYIKRHHRPGDVEYPHPVFKEQLEETYGVMVYQEDVMKIANAYGGLDMADADVLRRMMSGKSRSRDQLMEIEGRFFTNCRARGYDEKVSRDIWRQMESFAGYSFNKAHSASFAVESYQSLYLKTYFPKEFMVAVLNNYGGFYNRKVYVNEAKRAGARVVLPCVNRSAFNATIHGDDIYLGFDCLLHLEERLAHRIPEERKANGPYTSLENFHLRTGARLEQLVILIRAGAMRFMGTGKKELLWEAHLLLSGDKKAVRSPVLFETMSSKPVLPKLDTSPIEDLYDELELIGFPVSGSLFDLAKSTYRGEAGAVDLLQHKGKTIRMVGDFVMDKTLKTKRGDAMKFGTFLDKDGVFFDTVHFPQTLGHYPLRGAGLYLIEGKVIEDFGCLSIEVARCGKMPLKLDPRSE